MCLYIYIYTQVWLDGIAERELISAEWVELPEGKHTHTHTHFGD